MYKLEFRHIFDSSDKYVVWAKIGFSMRDPSKGRLVLLAYGPVLYHCAINNRECIMLHLDDDQSSLQHRVVGLGRQMTHMLSVVRVADSRVAVRLYMKKYICWYLGLTLEPGRILESLWNLDIYIWACLASRNSEDFVSQCSDVSLDSLETSALVVETVWAVQESGMCQISWKAVIRPPKSGEDAALLGSSVACNPIFN